MGALYSAASGECLVPRVRKTATAAERMRGLLGDPQPAAGEGLLIAPCRFIHTFGMDYAIDLVFIDSRGRVRKLARDVRPARLAGSFTAHATLELAAGALDSLPLQTGDRVAWREAA